MLSPAVEDYLKTIYKLQSGDEGTASTSDVARAMGVAPSSASNMIKRLAALRLVEHRSYHGVSLTDAGKRIALEIIRHHRLLETYLREVMGFDWDQMHAEAELLEHHISEEFEDRIEALLGYPTHDPHGDPIPTRDGEVSARETARLSVDLAGRDVSIVRLVDQDPIRLRMLETKGLLPGTSVHIDETSTSDRIIVRCPDGVSRIDADLAHSVLVVVDDDVDDAESGRPAQ